MDPLEIFVRMYWLKVSGKLLWFRRDPRRRPFQVHSLMEMHLIEMWVMRTTVDLSEMFVVIVAYLHLMIECWHALNFLIFYLFLKMKVF